MEKYKNVVIGFGKAGKTLAAYLAKKGEKTMLAEKDNTRYGGTCINVACIPTKILEHKARKPRVLSDAAYYRESVLDKDQKIAALREKNYNMVVSSGAVVENATASFVDPHTIHLSYADGSGKDVYAEYVFIDTGSSTFIPPIPGIDQNKAVYTSTSLMAETNLPSSLVIIGGGYIGLEFASYYRNFGSKVTILHKGDVFIPREDRDIASAVLESYKKRGIDIIFDSDVDSLDGHTVNYSIKGKKHQITGDAILVAVGRRANTKGLALENAGVKTNARGEIVVDSRLQTSVEHIYAMGDVKGGLQFTYISLDDFRILTQEGRSMDNRGAIPYTIFLDPPVSRVGLSESEAREKGFDVAVHTLPVTAIPKSLILERREGLLKAIIDKKDGKILGAHLFCVNSEEMINIIKLAIDLGLTYETLHNMVFNHPTMSEALNDLFAF